MVPRCGSVGWIRHRPQTTSMPIVYVFFCIVSRTCDGVWTRYLSVCRDMLAMFLSLPSAAKHTTIMINTSQICYRVNVSVSLGASHTTTTYICMPRMNTCMNACKHVYASGTHMAYIMSELGGSCSTSIVDGPTIRCSIYPHARARAHTHTQTSAYAHTLACA